MSETSQPPRRELWEIEQQAADRAAFLCHETEGDISLQDAQKSPESSGILVELGGTRTAHVETGISAWA